MPATDPDSAYLVLRSRNTYRQSKPFARLADTAVVRIGSSHREDAQNCSYASTRFQASDDFEWTIKIEYSKVAGETVEIIGCMNTKELAEQLKKDQIELHVRGNGDDPRTVLWPADENGDTAYTLDELLQARGLSHRSDVYYWWSILPVQLKQWDPSYGEDFSMKDPASQPGRAEYLKRAEADVPNIVKRGRGALTGAEERELMNKHGDMGFTVRMSSNEREDAALEDEEGAKIGAEL